MVKEHIHLRSRETGFLSLFHYIFLHSGMIIINYYSLDEEKCIRYINIINLNYRFQVILAFAISAVRAGYIGAPVVSHVAAPAVVRTSHVVAHPAPVVAHAVPVVAAPAVRVAAVPVVARTHVVAAPVVHGVHGAHGIIH